MSVLDVFTWRDGREGKREGSNADKLGSAVDGLGQGSADP